ncbi:MAG: copper ion binding protein [Defluviitaleaceae bacterium]|nr:copper ion binding protein [Defluviitaleaceae bacterium]
MVKTILNVEGMSCEHCVKAVKDAVGALNGVSGVSVDMNLNTVMVDHSEKVDKAQIEAAIKEEGYGIGK